MRNIYLLKADSNHFQNLVFVNQPVYNDLRPFLGQEITDWRPLKVRVFREDRANKNLPVSDFPTFATVPVFSRRACEILKKILEGNGQLLSLACDEGEYFAFNVTTLCDAFDKTASQVTELPGGGIIMVKKYVLLADPINEATIFKIPQTAVLDVFVDERFKNLVESNKLKGFLFEPVQVIDASFERE